MAGLHPRTLRFYEEVGLVTPSRTATNIRLYSERDMARIRRICVLRQEYHVNLNGIKVILEREETTGITG
jgi:MerR family transcriptional regulator/heat shock protein HspR